MHHGQVRHAAEGDLAAIAALEARAFPGLSYPYFALRQLFDVHGHHMLVSGDGGGGLHGYVLLAGDGNGRSWLLALAVDRTHRQQGHGRRLLDAVLGLADDRELGAVWLSVAPDNHPALRLYRTAGFCLAERRRDYLGPGQDRLVMVREVPRRTP
ncbi:MULTISPECIES: N-acetyltransferase [unclassified Streptomyces]|uniref:GNAT family N-acetyltransferase n=1 Tax=unclassified Streptomyces TaxID=2593676 RepID=UPI000C26EE15|nr:N-acetyltransferase [Streptomyces sp. CB01373]PJM95255.1 GNAT family N-acetyltransferase [Streptomyces sp. CB01373]